MKKWVTKELVDYTMGTTYENYPEEVIDKTKLFILDNIGCALGGSRSPIGNAVLKPFSNMGGAEEATLIGGGDQSSIDTGRLRKRHPGQCA